MASPATAQSWARLLLTALGPALSCVACGGKAEGNPAASGSAVDPPQLPRSIDLQQARFSKVVAGKAGYFCGIEQESGAPGMAADSGKVAGRVLCVQDKQVVNEKSGSFIDLSFTDAEASWSYFCGVRDTGALECDSDSGLELPLPVGRFTSVSVSFFNACALDDEGAMRCWTSALPGGTQPLDGRFVKLSVAFKHVCGLEKQPTLHASCRSSGDDGQRLLDGGYVGVAASSAGGCGAGIFPQNGILCWGDSSPAETLLVAGNFNEISMNLGGGGCALADGAPTCWEGQVASAPPNVVGPLHGLSVGSGHTCALDQSDHVVCW